MEAEGHSFYWARRSVSRLRKDHAEDQKCWRHNPSFFHWCWIVPRGRGRHGRDGQEDQSA